MTNLISSKAERDRIKADKQSKILSFLWEERFSTAFVLALLLNMTPNGVQRTLRRMENAELIKAHTIDFELSAWNLKIWGLTPTGALLATDLDEDPKFFEVGRIKPITIAHSLALQRVKVISLSSGWDHWESSSRMLKKANESRSEWIQVPDAVARSPKGRKVAIELERTAKTPKRYVEIFANYAEMISMGVIDEVIYVCPEQLTNRLENLFHRIEKIIFKGKVIPTPAGLLERFYFISYEEWNVRAKEF
ncbi:MobC family replication-relaxation protein [Acinetobacter pecorum]|uniref:Replication-relaxation family protein n=1 Tax=Acinetobacter pecorum TaxID=2762215 RepID=A0ABR8W1G1_9GAMM|nr:MobC family replication-relaxation protein [Acinetobacter pecorum]MBD8010571.1 replication-relaxation family protein [Acinetobacter pecorum]